MAEKTYTATVNKSTRPLTKIEQIMFSQSPESESLDELTRESALVIDVDYAVQMLIHNEKTKSGDTDYTTTYIVDTDGTCYRTSSPSLTTNLFDIADMFKEELESGEPFPTIRVFQKESQNIKGKSFITCTPWSGKRKEPSTPQDEFIDEQII